MAGEIKIGVSSCLLGEKVRYDGGHKLDRFITDTLGRLFVFVPVCPEVGCGLPVPRDAMRLEGDPARPLLVTSRTGIDVTGQMMDYCRGKVGKLEREGISGFILKSRSPSCGLSSVPVLVGNGEVFVRGLFASALAAHFPLLPVVEEAALFDTAIRLEFVERVRTYRCRDDGGERKNDVG
jgi:uncharacterized protein YbbK (DUF523 family)